jgi:hypothetical protein
MQRDSIVIFTGVVKAYKKEKEAVSSIKLTAPGVVLPIN